MTRKCSLAAVLFDNRDDFLIDELTGGLANELVFVGELRIEVDEVHSGKSSHVISISKPWKALRIVALGNSANVNEISEANADDGEHCNNARESRATGPGRRTERWGWRNGRCCRAMFQSGTVFQFGPFEAGLHAPRENQAIENTRVKRVASRQKACTGIAGQSACGCSRLHLGVASV